jgi:PKHD-type hydroxylase
MFNRYAGGQSYGMHVDNVFRQAPDASGLMARMRADLSGTLFLGDPSEYEGGELVIGDGLGVQKVKLPAGHLALYPTTSLHEVQTVTKGIRLASFFWVQSLVRDGGKRAVLLDLDLAIQKLYQSDPHHPSLDEFLGVYHNLLRRWSED